MPLALAGGPFFDKQIAAGKEPRAVSGGKNSNIADAIGRPYIPHMCDPDQNKLGFLIHDVARLMRKRFLEQDNEFGLSSAQWRLLFRLLKEDGVPQVRLAELLEVEPISVSRMVDRLAENGWVERRLARTDRRVRMIYATRKARDACGGIQEISASVYEEALSGLADDERRVLFGALGKMAQNLYGPEAADRA
ncbi:MarR family winged helix-turn-helix transcriptional regulator [Nitratireductor aquibiodomus]|uniref:MarR family winged helix-turn-helix transcriptional regulator n=1 Tax=Nitratireductor aquibiodomus TaxID=204799 RepID=UPI00278C0C2E|nr:MarR family transcriptional regulator [Nitratireductor aquibiodomus]